MSVVLAGGGCDGDCSGDWSMEGKKGGMWGREEFKYVQETGRLPGSKLMTHVATTEI